MLYSMLTHRKTIVVWWILVDLFFIITSDFTFVKNMFIVNILYFAIGKHIMFVFIDFIDGKEWHQTKCFCFIIYGLISDNKCTFTTL